MIKYKNIIKSIKLFIIQVSKLRTILEKKRFCKIIERTYLKQNTYSNVSILNRSISTITNISKTFHQSSRSRLIIITIITHQESNRVNNSTSTLTPLFSITNNSIFISNTDSRHTISQEINSLDILNLKSFL